MPTVKENYYINAKNKSGIDFVPKSNALLDYMPGWLFMYCTLCDTIIYTNTISKPEAVMLKILPIIPSSTSQKSLPIILILFSYHCPLFSYYSFALMLQVRIDI